MTLDEALRLASQFRDPQGSRWLEVVKALEVAVRHLTKERTRLLSKVNRQPLRRVRRREFIPDQQHEQQLREALKEDATWAVPAFFHANEVAFLLRRLDEARRGL